MKGWIICLFVGTLSLVACGTPISSQQQSDQPDVTPTATTQSEATLPTATSTAPLPTPTSTLVLSTPTNSAIEIVSPVATPTPPQAESTQPASDKLSEQVGDPVIIYEITGGFAGITEQYTIYADGRITRTDGREWQVPAMEVEQLLADIKAAGFFALDDRYIPLNTCCDRFTYVLTVNSDDQTKSVTTIDAAPNAPEELVKIQERLGNLLFTLE